MKTRLVMLKMAALGLSFFLPTTATAACYVNGASGRLANYCAIEKIQGARVKVRTAQLIDYKLKMEGSTRGLGFPGSVKPNSVSKAIYPILSYSDNINGGGSPEPLVLGILPPLYLEEELFRKEGVLVGLGVGLNGRYIHNEGRYLTYGVNASYAHSPKYGIGIATTSANISSINHIKNWWYLDLHANTSRVRKDIADGTNSNLSIVTFKVFASGDNAYSEASFGVNRHFSESYTQNQLILGYHTIHSNGVYSAIDVTFGEAVESQLATKMSLQAKVIIKLANKPLKLSAIYANADGKMMLGVERRDETYGINASYPLWRSLTASVGYRTTDSTIDHFDVTSPTFGLQFAPLNF